MFCQDAPSLSQKLHVNIDQPTLATGSARQTSGVSGAQLVIRQLMYIEISIYIYIYIYMYMYLYVCISIYIYIHTPRLVELHIHVYTKSIR